MEGLGEVLPERESVMDGVIAEQQSGGSFGGIKPAAKLG